MNKNNHLEFERKKVHFATLFQILEDGNFMVEYEKGRFFIHSLVWLKIPKCIGWILQVR
jgi:hypothetical protein